MTALVVARPLNVATTSKELLPMWRWTRSCQCPECTVTLRPFTATDAPIGTVPEIVVMGADTEYLPVVRCRATGTALACVVAALALLVAVLAVLLPHPASIATTAIALKSAMRVRSRLVHLRNLVIHLSPTFVNGVRLAYSIN